MSRETNKPDPQVAATVRAEMARADRNQRSLAAHLNRSQPAVSRRLSGTQSFTIDELLSIAAWLNVDPKVFVPADKPTAEMAVAL